MKILIGGNHEEEDEKQDYPYKVFSIRRLSREGCLSTYDLEVNVWDRNKYYSGAEAMMDELEKNLDFNEVLTDKMLIRTFKGTRENVPDPDKSIKRIRAKFTLHVYEREV
ncbi:MAG: hypothetical protein IKK59_05545 [Lachnospiraceae bacterium]|nr:hypothetical protein [Lachnospiraceae bacterium]